VRALRTALPRFGLRILWLPSRKNTLAIFSEKAASALFLVPSNKKKKPALQRAFHLIGKNVFANRSARLFVTTNIPGLP